MPQFPDSDPSWRARLEPVYRLYVSLLGGSDRHGSVAGKLLWTGELDENGCALMRAGNIAGAASLGCTGDPAALRHANRDGVADFLVTSLDEALRILKNEVRRRQAVSVGVSADPVVVVAQMRERGVLPDLLPPRERDGRAELDGFLAHGARRVEAGRMPEGWTFQALSPAPPEFDRVAAAVLPEGDELNRRWLRLSPRYLGPAARRVRSLACSPNVMTQLKTAWADHQTSGGLRAP